MNSVIISIGDELLIGQTINTNAGWMGKELNKNGIELLQVLTIPDEVDAIVRAMDYASEQADLVLLTGGLGPTKDDITKNTFAKYFNAPLIENKEALRNVEEFFSRYNREMLPVNKLQALVPKGAEMLLNKKGTAPGMWMESNKTVFVSMPGVPYEMKYLMEYEVLPRVRKLNKLPYIIHKTIMTHGIGESYIADKIEDIEVSLPSYLKLAYLPSPGIVKLRLTGRGADKKIILESIQEIFNNIIERIKDHVFAEEELQMHECLAQKLKERQFTLSTAESCTGGSIAALMTSLNGASSYFKGGVVAYANEVKKSALGVHDDDLQKYGAVSEAVVKQMALGVQSKFNTDYAIATSGIAGPLGGTIEKPVGTVWIALASPNGVFAKRYQMGDGREKVVKKTIRAAIGDLITLIG